MSAGSVLIAQRRLKLEEGKRARAYNDATGKTITCRPQGNLSIAYGINLETGLDDVEMDFLLNHRLTLVDAQLMACWWAKNLDDECMSVVDDLGYNQGVAGLLHYPKMLAALGAGNRQLAHDELLNSDAAKQLPSRYNVLASIFLTGASNGQAQTVG